jgi:hypothetical protein
MMSAYAVVGPAAGGVCGCDVVSGVVCGVVCGLGFGVVWQNTVVAHSTVGTISRVLNKCLGDIAEPPSFNVEVPVPCP